MEARIFGLGMSAVEREDGTVSVAIRNPVAGRTVEVELTQREAEMLAEWRVPVASLRKAG